MEDLKQPGEWIVGGGEDTKLFFSVICVPGNHPEE